MFTDRYGSAIREEVQENVEYEAGFTFLGKPVFYKLIPEFHITLTGSQTKNIASYIPPQTTDQCWIDGARSYVALGSGEYPNDNYDFKPVNSPNVNTQETKWAFETFIRKTASACNLICNIGSNVAGDKYYHVFVMYTKR